ncbi:MAG: SpoIID/LytB domain-containing protein, partial [Solirubrobacteraceae bacterium]
KSFQKQTYYDLSLDDYVRGVVSAEMPSSWSTQALDAQAVAARTYAITTSVSGNGYGLYSDTRSQMYRGVSAETSSTDAAVAGTQRQVVTLHGMPVVTYFFASSGGHTESIQYVWPGASSEPWLRGVDDSYDDVAGNPYYRWSVSMSMGSAAARLGSLVKGTFQGITVTQRGTSPRVVDATVHGSGGSTSVTGDRLQSAFGLMSTYMSFSTISTSAADTRASVSHGGAHALLARARARARAPSLRGRVQPADAGAAVDVQERLDGTWQAVLSHVRVGSGGAYRVNLPGPGHYRIVYRGLDGPAVDVR